MKLSEAMRLGSMLDPQGFYRLGKIKGGFLGLFPKLHTCAIGAAYRGAGLLTFGLDASGSAEVGVLSGDEDVFPILAIKCKPCPVDPLCPGVDESDQVSGTLYATITHLNDYHRWKREDIADYVEAIELLQEAKARLAEADPVSV